MSHNVYEVHTWKCSIPDCKETLTGYGSYHAEENGWINETLFGTEFDLCPFHYQELKGFLFDESPADPQL